jgi:hypothetical protein
MTHAYALKAPVQSFKVPAWATMHNLELAAGALVVVLLAFAVLRLSKGHRPAPAPVAAPKKSGGGPKLLLLAAAGVGGYVLFERHQNAAAPAKAAPAPSPSPAPHPTVTQTVAPHITMPAHLPLTGTQILIMIGIGAVVAIVLGGTILRRSS